MESKSIYTKVLLDRHKMIGMVTDAATLKKYFIEPVKLIHHRNI